MSRRRSRYLKALVRDDLKDKVVFIGGPRQVGKTTLSLEFLRNGSKTHPAYFNWDRAADRPALLAHEFPTREKLIVLDEIHKYARWRMLVKGFYDQFMPGRQLIVTGSARLDYYRKGGDSLLGRYFHYRLHPFSIGELGGGTRIARELLTLGGFPEPFRRGEKRFWSRWSRVRIEQILSEDLRDLQQVKEVSLLELLIEALPERVSTPLSLNQVAKHLVVSQETVARWIEIFERLYFLYRIAPYGEPRIKAVKKEQKLYFWDWAFAGSEGARFENMVAGQLLKYCHYIEDTEGAKMELRYLRDVNGREVDFVVLRDRRPLFAVECKLSDREIHPSIHYFQSRTKIPRFFQVHLGSADYERDRVRVLPFGKFSEEMGLP